MAIKNGEGIKVDGVYRIRRGPRALVTKVGKTEVHYRAAKGKRGRFANKVLTMPKAKFRASCTLLWWYEAE